APKRTILALEDAIDVEGSAAILIDPINQATIGDEAAMKVDAGQFVSRRQRMKPVALRPGRAKLSTNPAPTGSAMPTNTIGIVWVACSSGATPALESARMTSGASATISTAYFCTVALVPSPQR